MLLLGLHQVIFFFSPFALSLFGFKILKLQYFAYFLRIKNVTFSWKPLAWDSVNDKVGCLSEDADRCQVPICAEHLCIS